MRLWHENLLPLLPKQWLLGQHRECCAMRGLGWGKKHSVVDYVWKHPYMCLFRFHMEVMECLEVDGVNIDQQWKNTNFRGYKLGVSSLPNEGGGYRYPEHNEKYKEECIKNLKRKGIELQEYDEK